MDGSNTGYFDDKVRVLRRAMQCLGNKRCDRFATRAWGGCCGLSSSGSANDGLEKYIGEDSKDIARLEGDFSGSSGGNPCRHGGTGFVSMAMTG